MSYIEEIDLFPYVTNIIQNWRRILIIGLLFAIAGLTFSLMRPRIYKASASLLVTRSRATLALAEQFPTLNEPIDNQSRMEAILTIAQSDSILTSTFNALISQLPDPEKDYVQFKKSVEISNIGDAIIVSALSQDPDSAANIANEWAQKAALAINLSYSGEQPLSEIQSQLSIAKVNYEKAQDELEEFLEGNNISILEKQLEEAKNLLAIVSKETTNELSYLDSRRQRLEQFIFEIEALRQQIDVNSISEPGNLGDALAVMLVRTFGLSPLIGHTNINIDLQIDTLLTDNLSSAEYVTDVENILVQANQELVITEEAISNFYSEILRENPSSEIALISSQIRDFETLLEQESSRKLELTSSRDNAWTAYQALAQKELEILNALQENNLITIANDAIPPIKSESRGTVQNTLISGFLGVIFVVTWYIGKQWLESSYNEVR